MKRLAAFTPLIVLAVIAAAALFVLMRGQRGEGFASPLVGKPAPTLALPPLRAEAGPGPDLAGRPYVINFFASWCAPCELEHPLWTELAAQGLPIIGVAYKDRPEASAGFLARLGDPYAAVLLDQEGRGAAEFGVRKVPESFLIGADGRVLAHADGPIDAGFIERTLTPALLGPADPAP